MITRKRLNFNKKLASFYVCGTSYDKPYRQFDLHFLEDDIDILLSRDFSICDTHVFTH